jgi:hypothetical protein
MKRFIVSCTVLVVAYISVTAQTVERFAPTSARMAALGGPHAASVAGIDSLFENPAGFVSERTEFIASALVFNPSGPIFDIAGLLLGGTDQLMSELPSLFDDRNRFYASVDVLGPLAFGYVGKGLGFGLFNKSVTTVNAASLLSVAYNVSEEILLAGGYASRFALGPRQSLDLGIMPKGFIRASIGSRMSLDEFYVLIQDLPSALDSPFVMTSGVGFDVGVQWSLDDMLTVGLVARDAYSPAMTTTYASYSEFADSPKDSKVGDSVSGLIPADVSLGLAYKPDFEVLDVLGVDVLVLLDYVDILDLFSTIPRHPILNVCLGMELTLLDILSIRAGIKDALPTAGFGIDLSAFTFSLAMYGEELSLEPGGRPVYNLLAALDFKY